MYIRIALALSLALLCGGCTDKPDSRIGAQVAVGAQSALAGSGTTAAPRPLSRFASAPDRGDLVAYPAQPVIRHDGAYTWHRAGLSEDHALGAIGGVMNITTPGGKQLQFDYERHVEHPSGDWTWIGRLVGASASDEIVVTFGHRAAYGSIAQPGQAPLKLTMSGGVSWLIETDRSKIADIDNPATRPRTPDFLIPPKIKVANGASTDASPPPAKSSPASAQAAGTPTVDVLLGYTTGFAAAQGGQSQAVTRLNNMVEITNQGYANSQVAARIRLVHAMQVNYPDSTSNDSALEALTGFRAPSTPTTPDPAFAALRSARNQYGADLVSLVRQFNTPENDGCGIAWLIGGNQEGIAPSDEYFGYSVVSDGRDAGTDGKTYFCREETLAHELGHNMGSQHDRATATVDGKLKHGLYPYSFGYKTTTGSGNFYTVMAYGDSGQASYRVFSNPRIFSCGGFSCGVENSADNARSLDQAMPIVANFRASVVQAKVVNLYGISKMGGSGTTEIHMLNGSSNFQSFGSQLATGLHQTGRDDAWKFQLADQNGDGVLDLYGFAKQGGSGRTEIHVLDGATSFATFRWQAATVLHQTGSNNAWEFKLGDFNRDGVLDAYAIKKQGGSNATELHILNGATGFQSFLANIATALHATGSDYSWEFELDDFNRDGVLDLLCIAKMGGSGTTEVHVLNGATGFQSFIWQSATALHQTGTTNIWDFKLGDYNQDGMADLYAIKKQGGSGRTEVHILDRSTGYQTFLANVATALPQTGSDSSWDFELTPAR